MKRLIIAAVAVVAFAACEAGDYYDPAPYMEGGSGKVAYDADSPGGGSDSGDMPGEGQGQQNQAGIVTAGEWRDLDHWSFWGGLMTSEDEVATDQAGNEYTIPGYSSASGYWKFWTGNRVAIKVTDADGKPLPGVAVQLKDGDKVIWKAVSDVAGCANCWAGLHDAEYQLGTLSIALNGVDVNKAVAVTGWSDEAVKMNEFVVSNTKEQSKDADILFIVDATGSMMDEISFLKSDLLDILNRCSSSLKGYGIRTGALFYRDVYDQYVTRESKFTKDFTTTVNFIKKQQADGGGDYPEAVHTALEVSLQKFDWKDDARARIAFIILDAPPHHDQQGVIESVQESIDTYAAKGIKLIPVASSGVDKKTEFLLRMMAITTGGTYVFLTDDSGVGNSHIKPTVGEYEVEQLNNLMVRLIEEYVK